ncbi:MAG: multicopper oxidase domain-containing protein, partial [Rhodospirillales bacterium]|nr:multicopper oxidase domain-containing protein [Acetobacter sp.]
ELVPTVITHIFTTNLPSGSCSGVKYPITSSSSIPAYPGTSSTPGSPNQPTGGYDGPKTTVTDIETIYTTVCPGTSTTVSEGETVTKTYDTTSVVTTTVPVTVTVPAGTASPSEFPSCWNSCFQKTGASSKEEACKPEVGKCIDSTCSAEESAAFDAWAMGFCVADTTTSDVPVVPATTSSTEGSPVTDTSATSTPSGGSCSDNCYKQNGVTSKEEACKPEVGKCIDENCSADESASFDAWAVSFCVADTTSTPAGDVPATSGTEGSPVTDSTPTSTPSGSCSDSCYKENGVTSKEQACKPEVGQCIDSKCPEEAASFDAWASSFCVEGGNGGELPTEPAGGNNGGVPTEVTSVKPVTKPFQYGEWTSYYTDFETVTLTSYLTETAAVPTGGYGSGGDGNTEGSPNGPATTAPPNGGYGGHQTTKTCEYETEITTAYTTVCPATESDGMTTSTVTTTSTKTMTFTITTTDYPEQTSSSTKDGSMPPYPTGSSSPSGGYGTGVHPTGGYGTGSVTSSSMTSSTPAGPTDTPAIPNCWAKCFAKYEVESEHELCGDINVETCIKAECPLDSYNAYEGWLKDYCGAGSTTSSSGVVGPTGSGAPHPTGTSGPTGTGPAGTGTSGPTGTTGPTGTESSSCAMPTATKACKRCEGQPGTDKYCGLDINTNIYKDGGAPITCNTVEYNWEITTGNISPDGVERWAILVNGQSPGPMIEANWGDEIIVHVKNSMPASDLNGTTIHWHGIHQKGTPEYDGVPSLTQCPIAPGDSFTYKFKAAQFGSSWYHSHFALQAYDGLYGPMVIHGPVQDGIEYDGEEFVALQDWMHTPLNFVYHELELVQNQQRSSPTLQNGLINGKNTWENGGERWSMTVTKGKTYRLRVLNAAIQSTFKFYIDGHSFKVIAADFVPIVPYETNIINLNNGQRYDIIFTADQPSANYWMRSDVQAPCSNVTNGLDIKAIVHYDDAPEGTPTSQGYQSQPECIDEPMASLVPI